MQEDEDVGATTNKLEDLQGVIHKEIPIPQVDIEEPVGVAL